MKVLSLRSVLKKTGNTYEIELTADDRTTAHFLLEVEDGDIQVVKWSSDFARYMDHNMSPVRPVFEAVKALHSAQKMSVP